MKRLVEEVSCEGLEKLMGQKVILLCSSYFYVGKLVGVNSDCVLLSKPAIVYETGTWSNKTYQDIQSLCMKELYVQRAAIESFGVSK